MASRRSRLVPKPNLVRRPSSSKESIPPSLIVKEQNDQLDATEQKSKIILSPDNSSAVKALTPHKQKVTAENTSDETPASHSTKPLEQEDSSVSSKSSSVRRSRLAIKPNISKRTPSVSKSESTKSDMEMGHIKKPVSSNNVDNEACQKETVYQDSKECLKPNSSGKDIDMSSLTMETGLTRFHKQSVKKISTSGSKSIEPERGLELNYENNEHSKPATSHSPQKSSSSGTPHKIMDGSKQTHTLGTPSVVRNARNSSDLPTKSSHDFQKDKSELSTSNNSVKPVIRRRSKLNIKPSLSANVRTSLDTVQSSKPEHSIEDTSDSITPSSIITKCSNDKTETIIEKAKLTPHHSRMSKEPNLRVHSPSCLKNTEKAFLSVTEKSRSPREKEVSDVLPSAKVKLTSNVTNTDTCVTSHNEVPKKQDESNSNTLVQRRSRLKINPTVVNKMRSSSSDLVRIIESKKCDENLVRNVSSLTDSDSKSPDKSKMGINQNKENSNISLTSNSFQSGKQQIPNKPTENLKSPGKNNSSVHSTDQRKSSTDSEELGQESSEGKDDKLSSLPQRRSRLSVKPNIAQKAPLSRSNTDQSESTGKDETDSSEVSKDNCCVEETCNSKVTVCKDTVTGQKVPNVRRSKLNVKPNVTSVKSSSSIKAGIPADMNIEQGPLHTEKDVISPEKHSTSPSQISKTVTESKIEKPLNDEKKTETRRSKIKVKPNIRFSSKSNSSSAIAQSTGKEVEKFPQNQTSEHEDSVESDHQILAADVHKSYDGGKEVRCTEQLSSSKSFQLSRNLSKVFTGLQKKGDVDGTSSIPNKALEKGSSSVEAFTSPEIPSKTTIRSRLPKAKPNIPSVNRKLNRVSAEISKSPSYEPSESQDPTSQAPVLETSQTDDLKRKFPAPSAHPTEISTDEVKSHVLELGDTSDQDMKDIKPFREKKATKRKRYKVSAPTDQPPDKHTMTMKDLIYWNPSTSPMKNESLKKKAKFDYTPESKSKTQETVDDGDESFQVPQIKIGPDGNIILDEKSVIINSPKSSNFSTAIVEESEPVANYGSFRKIKNRKTWTEKETKKFFAALSIFGTDFSLMSALFPKRERQELKNKFKREERSNKFLVDKAISDRQSFDASMFEEGYSDEDDNKKEKKVKQTAGRKSKKKRKHDENTDNVENVSVEENKEKLKKACKRLREKIVSKALKKENESTTQNSDVDNLKDSVDDHGKELKSVGKKKGKRSKKLVESVERNQNNIENDKTVSKSRQSSRCRTKKKIFDPSDGKWRISEDTVEEHSDERSEEEDHSSRTRNRKQLPSNGDDYENNDSMSFDFDDESQNGSTKTNVASAIQALIDSMEEEAWESEEYSSGKEVDAGSVTISLEKQTEAGPFSGIRHNAKSKDKSFVDSDSNVPEQCIPSDRQKKQKCLTRIKSPYTPQRKTKKTYFESRDDEIDPYRCIEQSPFKPPISNTATPQTHESACVDSAGTPVTMTELEEGNIVETPVGGIPNRNSNAAVHGSTADGENLIASETLYSPIDISDVDNETKKNLVPSHTMATDTGVYVVYLIGSQDSDSAKQSGGDSGDASTSKNYQSISEQISNFEIKEHVPSTDHNSDDSGDSVRLKDHSVVPLLSRIVTARSHSLERTTKHCDRQLVKYLNNNCQQGRDDITLANDCPNPLTTARKPHEGSSQSEDEGFVIKEIPFGDINKAIKKILHDHLKNKTFVEDTKCQFSKRFKQINACKKGKFNSNVANYPVESKKIIVYDASQNKSFRIIQNKFPQNVISPCDTHRRELDRSLDCNQSEKTSETSKTCESGKIDSHDDNVASNGTKTIEKNENVGQQTNGINLTSQVWKKTDEGDMKQLSDSMEGISTHATQTFKSVHEKSIQSKRECRKRKISEVIVKNTDNNVQKEKLCEVPKTNLYKDRRSETDDAKNVIKSTVLNGEKNLKLQTRRSMRASVSDSTLVRKPKRTTVHSKATGKKLLKNNLSYSKKESFKTAKCNGNKRCHGISKNKRLPEENIHSSVDVQKPMKYERLLRSHDGRKLTIYGRDLRSQDDKTRTKYERTLRSHDSKTQTKYKGHLPVRSNNGKSQAKYKRHITSPDDKAKMKYKSHLRIHDSEKQTKCKSHSRSHNGEKQTKNNRHLRSHKSKTLTKHKAHLRSHHSEKQMNYKSHLRSHNSKKPMKYKSRLRSHNISKIDENVSDSYLLKHGCKKPTLCTDSNIVKNSQTPKSRSTEMSLKLTEKYTKRQNSKKGTKQNDTTCNKYKNGVLKKRTKKQISKTGDNQIPNGMKTLQVLVNKIEKDLDHEQLNDNCKTNLNAKISPSAKNKNKTQKESHCFVQEQKCSSTAKFIIKKGNGTYDDNIATHNTMKELEKTENSVTHKNCRKHEDLNVVLQNHKRQNNDSDILYPETSQTLQSKEKDNAHSGGIGLGNNTEYPPIVDHFDASSQSYLEESVRGNDEMCVTHTYDSDSLSVDEVYDCCDESDTDPKNYVEHSIRSLIQTMDVINKTGDNSDQASDTGVDSEAGTPLVLPFTVKPISTNEKLKGKEATIGNDTNKFDSKSQFTDTSRGTGYCVQNMTEQDILCNTSTRDEQMKSKNDLASNISGISKSPQLQLPQQDQCLYCISHYEPEANQIDSPLDECQQNSLKKHIVNYTSISTEAHGNDNYFCKPTGNNAEQRFIHGTQISSELREVNNNLKSQSEHNSEMDVSFDDQTPCIHYNTASNVDLVLNQKDSHEFDCFSKVTRKQKCLARIKNRRSSEQNVIEYGQSPDLLAPEKTRSNVHGHKNKTNNENQSEVLVQNRLGLSDTENRLQNSEGCDDMNVEFSRTILQGSVTCEQYSLSAIKENGTHSVQKKMDSSNSNTLCDKDSHKLCGESHVEKSYTNCVQSIGADIVSAERHMQNKNSKPIHNGSEQTLKSVIPNDHSQSGIKKNKPMEGHCSTNIDQVHKTVNKAFLDKHMNIKKAPKRFARKNPGRLRSSYFNSRDDDLGYHKYSTKVHHQPMQQNTSKLSSCETNFITTQRGDCGNTTSASVTVGNCKNKKVPEMSCRKIDKTNQITEKTSTAAQCSSKNVSSIDMRQREWFPAHSLTTNDGVVVVLMLNSQKSADKNFDGRTSTIGTFPESTEATLTDRISAFEIKDHVAPEKESENYTNINR